MNISKEKKDNLKSIFAQCASEDMCVAFSGGVDSSLVLVMACEAAKSTGKKVYALTMDTILHPKADLEIAKKVLSGTTAEHVVITMDELAVPEIRNNPVNRCYLCKKAIFSRMLTFAKEKGISLMLEGSNEDDLHVYRPGLAAVRELGVKSPLADCHMTKAEVRALAEEYKIPVADRPSAPCMATRLPYGAEIDLELLKRIYTAEETLRAMGLKNVRVRVHGDILRLEVDAESILNVVEHRREIMNHLKKVGCPYVTLDLEGFRSGSMDIGIKLD